MSEIYDRFQTLHDDALLRVTEVATLLSVNPKTISRWCDQGKLDHIRTLGGRRRIRVSAVRAMMKT